MKTAIFRIARVLTAAGSPVARVDAVDADGRELRLEVAVSDVQDVAAGRGLVLHWAVHELPAEAPATSVAADTPRPTTAPPSAASVDQQFMDLMARTRRPAGPPAEQTRGAADGLEVLLGAAQRKGQRDGR